MGTTAQKQNFWHSVFPKPPNPIPDPDPPRPPPRPLPDPPLPPQTPQPPMIEFLKPLAGYASPRFFGS